MPEAAASADAVELPRRRSPRRAALVALRPRQWAKNLLLFAGIIFAAKLGEVVRWAEALTAFAVYCAASSAAYIVNDVQDADDDRRHPVKRRRPVAARELTNRQALMLAAVLGVAALVLAAALGAPSVALLAAFALLQAAYTLQLKHVALVDVLVIAGLFVIRAAAGAAAVDVRISPWLLVCTGLLALFLALGKRRAELVLVERTAHRGRPVLDGYSIVLVDQLLTVVAAATIAAYTVYTLTARDTPALAATVPFVVFGLLRYLLLVHRHSAGEEPENVLLGDLPILVAVAGWAVTSAAILAFA
ncbi:4-hydroxybenzoate polyprenyltransferase and related prenyltransferase [Gaiella occulta]|uniref:4-hydroxybenzoate polyprenyltransferase and related prenyltransferase n=1 Tax=Gaiella occulta TaxID=1002870 RepID=A0A7M2YXU7_9ACTN|nr:decaprenyl-phosphate phosphoribosyltransferase [Gaiella occulta]RDI74975.1 4-hydroxybenzoate polyprenyltransferase and related prenyltransferase [Gaiella occulta]